SHVFSDAEKSRARFGALYAFGTLTLGQYAPAVQMETAGFALDSLEATLSTGETYFSESIYRRYNENHKGESEGGDKTAAELKPTPADKARYRVGQMGSGPMSVLKAASPGTSQSQGNRTQSYAQSVGAWTKLRDGLAGVLKTLQASQR